MDTLKNEAIVHTVDRKIPRPTKHAGIISRLGWFSTATLSFSFAICLGCLAFLAFLWFSDQNNKTAWRAIVINGWLTRSITITSLILRWAAAAQGMACTSMLAAVLLQQGGITLPAAAAVSLTRFDNTGPWVLLGRMRADWLRGSSISAGLLTALLSVTTVSLQFTSTALLSQVGLAPLPVAITVPETFYGVSRNGPTFSLLSGDDSSYVYQRITPTGYPAFAEWISNNNNAEASSNTDAHHGEFGPSQLPGIIDTGTVMRAFLPIQDASDRSRLVEYHGFGTVVDTRVVCVRPKLANVTFSTNSGNVLKGIADIGPNTKPSGFFRKPDRQGSNNFSASFECGFAVAYAGYDTEGYGWPVNLCETSHYNSKEGIFSAMDEPGQEEIGPAYLLVNATMAENATAMDGSDVWESIVLPRSRTSDAENDPMILQITLCLTALQAQEMEINATRSSVIIPPEPALVWNWNTSSPSYNSSAVLRQLGAEQSAVSISERSIFDLRPRSWKWPERPSDVERAGGALATTWGTRITGRVYENFGSRAQFATLAKMVQLTRNPALAVQGYLTTLCAITYYDRIAVFDTAAGSSRVYNLQVIQPLGWTAYTIVVAVVLSHLLLVLLTLVIFSRTGKLSWVGNAWAVVSQLLGPVTEGWIRDVTATDDKTVKSWLQSQGLDGTFVRVDSGSAQGRVQLVRKDKLS